MGRHRKAGRPKGSKSGKAKISCKNVTAYKRRHGRIVDVHGVNKRTCLK